MRAGLGTIQQTLTPEAANVLNHSISEAGRRNHGQTTPLHVAATLLASPSGFLRQACIRSHPNSSHPLQCRALELCFSVALERLPPSQNTSPGMEPPISNALMAALKRAQAHQRRGCPEQQQQPLLAVKVELEQLIISILDDPSVSRVMREASFSSPAVKAIIEQCIISQSSANANPSPIGIGFRPAPTPMPLPTRNPILSPRLSNSSLPGQQRSDEVKRVIDILLRKKKRNPVLVGESEPEAVIRELLKRIEKGEIGEGPFENVHVISMEKEFSSDKTQIHAKLKELGSLMETQIGSPNGGGMILDLGDLKWLVEQPVSVASLSTAGVQQVASQAGQVAVAEIGNLLARFGEGGNGRIWLIGTATCETYLRCQVYHPTMENDWNLQAVPITSRSPLPGMFPRLGTNGILRPSIEGFNPLKSFSPATAALPRQSSLNMDSSTGKASCCPLCLENYEQEFAELVKIECWRSSSDVKSEADHPPLPQWLKNAKASQGDVKTTEEPQCNDQELLFKQKTRELQKKWIEKCQQLHPNYHQTLERTLPVPLSMTALYNPNQLLRQPCQPRSLSPRKLGEALRLNANQSACQVPLEHDALSPPGSPVRTDLILGRAKVAEATNPQKFHEECAKDFLGCISSEPQAKFLPELLGKKFANALDADSFKKLLKGLMEKAWWQPEAASAVASAVTRCKLGNGKRRGVGLKGDAWLLFAGPDGVGKKKMASVLSEQLCGAGLITICLGSRRDNEESEMNFRGRTALDRIAEAVRRNPFSVIMLEDIDEADALVRGSIRRAMERGRISDSHGREITVGNVIFILTGNWSSVDTNNFGKGQNSDVKRPPFQLRLTIAQKSAKRRTNWLHDDEDRAIRQKKEPSFGLSFDLNQLADAEDDKTDGSHNSSDLTVDHEDEHGLANRQLAITSVPHELVSSADDAIEFKPVDFAFIRREIKKTIGTRFSIDVDDKLSLEVENEVLDEVMHGLWHGRTSLEQWATSVLIPGFQHLKTRLPSSHGDTMIVRLELDCYSHERSDNDWLPSKITVMVDGA